MIETILGTVIFLGCCFVLVGIAVAWSEAFKVMDARNSEIERRLRNLEQ